MVDRLKIALWLLSMNGVLQAWRIAHITTLEVYVYDIVITGDNAGCMKERVRYLR